ncbi:MAG: hypothetical protein IJF88_03155 [Oscillospiraceae bacterium]|nr:hypothetical protein [Oscillospiraceae bacterium]
MGKFIRIFLALLCIALLFLSPGPRVSAAWAPLPAAQCAGTLPGPELTAGLLPG